MNAGGSRTILGNWNLWPGMQCYFSYIDLSYYKERQYFVIPFIEDIRNWYLL